MYNSILFNPAPDVHFYIQWRPDNEIDTLSCFQSLIYKRTKPIAWFFRTLNDGYFIRHA